jgi:hypothetical protein
MQMIGHEKIIADEPCRRDVLPNLMQRALNRGLRQPFAAFLSAHGEEDPIRSAKRNMNAFGWCTTPGIAEGDFVHGKFLTDRWRIVNNGKAEWSVAAPLARVAAQIKTYSFVQITIRRRDFVNRTTESRIDQGGGAAPPYQNDWLW